MSRDVFIKGRSGSRLHCVDWGGKGVPVLLVHGMGGHTHWWDRAAPILNGAFRVVALDFRGHGDSGWIDPPRYQIGDYAADIEDARRAFGWNRFFLVGHSLGARACLHYAKRHAKRLDRLALLDFLTAVDARRHARYAGRMKRRQPTYSSAEPMVKAFHLQPRGTTLDRPGLRLLARQGVRRLASGRWTWKFDWRAFFFDYAPIWADLRGLDVPCLVMRGEHSAVMPRAQYEKTLKALRRAEGSEIPGAHHHLPLDAPEKVSSTLVEFGRRNFAKIAR